MISTEDRRRLGSLIDEHFKIDPLIAAVLAAKLEDSRYAESHDMPRTTVAMNCLVELADPASRKTRQVVLAYPEDVEFVENAISVLEPLGIALLGSSVGDTVQWRDETRPSRMTVLRVIHPPQPAAAATASPAHAMP